MLAGGRGVFCVNEFYVLDELLVYILCREGHITQLAESLECYVLLDCELSLLIIGHAKPLHFIDFIYIMFDSY